MVEGKWKSGRKMHMMGGWGDRLPRLCAGLRAVFVRGWAPPYGLLNIVVVVVVSRGCPVVLLL